MDADRKRTKNPHPRATSNCFSSLTFAWLTKVFWTGFHRDLETTDLFDPLKEHKSSLLGNKFEALWEDEKKRNKPSLLRVIVRCYGWECAQYGLVLFVLECLIRFSQPLFLGRLIMYFSTSDKVVSKEEAYVYASLVVLCSLLNVFMIHPYMMGIMHMGMKFRVACCSLIYRKALKLSKTALGETTVGQVVNLLSNDVNRFDVAIIFLHYLWIGPLETILVTYIMWIHIEAASIAGILFMLLFIPLQAYMGKRISILRLRTALRTDERVRLMNEIISGIQVIKMYAWELPFVNLVYDARKQEINEIRKTSYIRGVLVSFIMFVTRVSLFLSILTYVLLGNNITAENVFMVTCYYNLLRQTMTVFFPQGISQVAEAAISIGRLQDFMMYDETRKPLTSSAEQDDPLKKKISEISEAGLPNSFLTSQPNVNSNLTDEERAEAQDEKKRTTDADSKQAIVLNDVTTKWIEGQPENTLSHINMRVKSGSLIGVIGPVGAGKTSLLHVLLNELPITGGTLEINGKMSFASQEPWLFVGSIRQNILFGAPLDRLRYNMVVRKCALERDFELFPHGDKTIVGERGVSLSGGQRARINMARSVYRQADIYLFDDPLSAVDTHVGRQLFENCILNYLSSKTRIIITHQLQYLHDVDHIYILKNGVIAAEGTFGALQASGLDFAKLLSSDEEEEDIIDTNEEEKEKPMKERFSSTRSTVSIDEIDLTETILEERRMHGSVGKKIYSAYLRAAGSCCLVSTMFGLAILAQALASGSDYWTTYWVNQEELVSLNKSSTPFVAMDKKSLDDAILHMETGGYMTRLDFIYIYTVIVIALIAMTLARAFMFFWLATQASQNLHNTMFKNITHATMRFFNTNPSGRILNRFSKDIGSIDDLLPIAAIDVLQIGLAMIGIVIVILIVNWWLIFPTLCIFIIFYLLRIYYLATSRSVKRLESIARSPVFSHLNASLQGITTIRAFGAQKVLESEFDSHQDTHSAAWYLFISTSRAFGFWLDLVCVIFIAMVTMSFLVMGKETGGNVGLAITQALGLTGMFQWGMRQSTELENQMTSVERVVEYNDIEMESPLESTPENKPRDSWPENGEIIVKDVWLSYSPSGDPALRGLEFFLLPAEKLGIVGRTGAGKSSIISALFRLAFVRGTIKIDGVDTSKLGLHDLRTRLSIIPQEPVLFSGSMRKNLDPFSQYSDDVLWKALEEVKMKEVVKELGLNGKVAEGGTNLSVGQRQLVCLARAIVRNNKVLIMDEATANVDPQTDALIQMTIRKKFADCTVLTIAHRLHTVMDSDKVLVMDAGRAVEFDHPYILLQNKQGVLKGMVNQTGRSMSDALMKVAKRSFESGELRKKTN